MPSGRVQSLPWSPESVHVVPWEYVCVRKSLAVTPKGVCMVRESSGVGVHVYFVRVDTNPGGVPPGPGVRSGVSRNDSVSLVSPSSRLLRPRFCSDLGGLTYPVPSLGVWSSWIPTVKAYQFTVP